MNKSESRVQNLLFLLAASPMATGCIITTGGGDDDDGTSLGGTTTNAMSTTDESGSDGSTMGGMATTTGGADGSSSSGAGDGADGDSSSSGGAALPEGCVSYVEKYLECYPDVAMETAEMYCIMSYEIYAAGGDECVAAWEAYTACLSELDCENFTDENDPTCEEEDGMIDKLCPPM